MSMSMKMRVNSGTKRSQRSSNGRAARLSVVRASAGKGDVGSSIGASLASLAMAITLPFCQVQGAAAMDATNLLNKGDSIQANSGTADSKSDGIESAEAKTEGLQKAAGRFKGEVVNTDPLAAVKENAPVSKTGAKDNTGVFKDVGKAVAGIFESGPALDIGASIKQTAGKVRGMVDTQTAKPASSGDGSGVGSKAIAPELKKILGNPRMDIGASIKAAADKVQGKVSDDVETAKQGPGAVKDKVASSTGQSNNIRDSKGRIPEPIAPEIKETLGNLFGGPKMDIGASIKAAADKVQGKVSDDVETAKQGPGAVKDKVASSTGQSNNIRDSKGRIPEPIAPEIKESLGNLFGNKPSMDIGASIKKAAAQVKGKVSGDVNTAKDGAKEGAKKAKVEVSKAGMAPSDMNMAQTRFDAKKLSPVSPQLDAKVNKFFGDKPRMDIGASIKQAASQFQDKLPSPGGVDTGAVGAKAEELKNKATSVLGSGPQDVAGKVKQAGSAVQDKVSSDIDTVKSKTAEARASGDATDASGQLPPAFAPEIKESLTKPQEVKTDYTKLASDKLKGLVTGAPDAVKDKVSSDVDTVKGKVSSDVNTVKSKADGSDVASTAGDVKDKAASKIGEVKDKAFSLFGQSPSMDIGASIKQAASQVQDKLPSPGDIDTGALGAKAEEVKSKASSLFGSPKQVGGNAGAAVQDAADKVKGKVSSDVNTAQSKLNGSSIGAKVDDAKQSVMSVFGSGPQDAAGKLKQAGNAVQDKVSSDIDTVKGQTAAARSSGDATYKNGQLPPAIAPEIKEDLRTSFFGKPKQFGARADTSAEKAAKEGTQQLKSSVKSNINAVKDKVQGGDIKSNVNDAVEGAKSLFGQPQNVGNKLSQAADQVKSKVSGDVSAVKNNAGASEITGIFGKPKQIGRVDAGATAKQGAALAKGKVSSDINTVKDKLDTGAIGTKVNEAKESVLSVFGQ